MKSQETHCSLNKFETKTLLYPAHPHFPAPKIRPCRYFHCWQMARRLPRGEGGRKNCFEPLSKLLETYFRAKNEDKHSLGGEIENWSGCAEMFEFCLLTKGVDLEAYLYFQWFLKPILYKISETKKIVDCILLKCTFQLKHWQEKYLQARVPKQRWIIISTPSSASFPNKNHLWMNLDSWETA